MKRRLVRAGLVAAVFGLASCAFGPSHRTPKPDVPDRFAASTQAAAGTSSGTAVVELADWWWKSLNDPELNSLVDRAVKSNLDIEVALVRLQQARTPTTVHSCHTWPTYNN